MDFRSSFEEVMKVLKDLCERNRQIPILVEGKKDESALRRLGITGEIARVHSGRSIPDLCDMIASRYTEIIILTDWDREGGHLCHSIEEHLGGRVICDTSFRMRLLKNAVPRTIEGLPSWLETMERKRDKDASTGTRTRV
ncbi:MAG: toprim domain-containing protein [Methanoculleaceae archaeon]